MPIYTRTGDKGETALYGGGRIGKEHARIEAYGSVDELNSFVGLAISRLEERDADLKSILKKIQNDLFALGADLATPMDSKAKTKRITAEHTANIEKTIDQLEKDLPELHKFILPGGSPWASLLHICRTVCRRAERNVVALGKKEKINDECIKYLNRLSSLFFELARVLNRRAGVKEEEWEG